MAWRRTSRQTLWPTCVAVSGVNLKVLVQSGSDVTGTWDSTSVNWTGQINGAVKGSSFEGQFKFSGTTSDGVVCTATATVVGPASGSKMTWTSFGGFIGGSCPAPLPIGVQIDVQHQ